MKAIFAILLIATVMVSSCDRRDCAKGTPQCVKHKIGDFEKVACNGGSVKEYRFQGETVYVFDPVCCCDMTSEVTDEDCNTLGHLGGFAGNTKINGEDFSKAKFQRTLWKK